MTLQRQRFVLQSLPAIVKLLQTCTCPRTKGWKWDGRTNQQAALLCVLALICQCQGAADNEANGSADQSAR